MTKNKGQSLGWLVLVLLPPFPGREAVVFVERLGEVELVWIAAAVRHRLDGQAGGAQQFGGAGEPGAYDELLGRAAHHLFEPAAEIIPVELAEARHLVHSELPLIVLLDVDHGLMNIVILPLPFVRAPAAGGIFDQIIQKQRQMPHQMQRGAGGVLGKIQQMVPQYIALPRRPGLVDGLILLQSRIP